MPSSAARDTPVDGPAAERRRRADSNSPVPARDRRSRKRARLTLACEECQVRKVRCDGQRPGMLRRPNAYGTLRLRLACTACISKHGPSANCLYQSERATAAFSREYVLCPCTPCYSVVLRISFQICGAPREKDPGSRSCKVPQFCLHCSAFRF